GEAILLVFFRRQRIELGQMVAQQVLFVAARRELPRRVGLALPRFAPIVPGLRERVRGDAVLGEGVEDHAVVGGIEQPALLELALDLDQALAELAQQPDARRLVVDKGAAAPVGADQPAQHDSFAVAVEPGLAQDRMRRMVAPDREFRRYGGLLSPGSNQTALRPFAERQTQRIEQDRLAGAGLAGQHAQAGTEGEVEAVDQYNVANIEAEQHCKPQLGALNHIGASAAKPASVRRRVARAENDRLREAGALSRSRAPARGAERGRTGSDR